MYEFSRLILYKINKSSNLKYSKANGLVYIPSLTLLFPYLKVVQNGETLNGLWKRCRTNNGICLTSLGLVLAKMGSNFGLGLRLELPG